MDLAVLLLRLLLAGLLLAHALQKTLGWFGGNGLQKQAGIFANLGLRPGRHMVVVASTSELAAAVLLAVGFITPLATLMTFATMTVAGLTMHLSARKFWNVAGGGEYPYVLAGIAVALGFSGAGQHSVDSAIASDHSAWMHILDPSPALGAGVVAAGLLGAVPFAMIILRNRQSTRIVNETAAAPTGRGR